ncbi:E3 ubiquitin-protein like [Actinidia chinensis var. chinensis]|uniref:RING-type E3 ubiquitin transferase n=1 Tax=Actinidia chinensis var. chinensis TaxID=1590841 RepID=A0A2R6PRM2_ACTCC|nr:E3 ubiquitin-protein like [Actinidia chinensis var. chinensis]
MGQRNLLMIDLEHDQQAQSHLPPEPFVHFGNIATFPQPNVHMILPAAGNTANFDIHHLPDGHENALFYGMSQYNSFQHQPVRNLDLGVATATNYYNPYMTPSGTGVFHFPMNQAPHDQLPSSSNSRNIGIPTDDYRRNDHFVDGVRAPFKRKSAEGIPGNFQYCHASAGSSSAIVPLHTRPIEPGVTLRDAASFPDPNHLIQANYMGQAFPSASSPWLGQQFSSNSGDGGTMSWSQAPALTYSHGSGISGGGTEPANMGTHGYQETASNRNSTPFLHLPPIHQGHSNIHHPSHPMQGARCQNINFHSQVATTSHRFSTNNPFQDGIEVGPRYVGPAPPTGIRIYRPHRRALMPEAAVSHHDLPRLRVLPADEVAILESPGYYEVGSSHDHHREMRLDIDHMSYEELLALGERIGNVGTGLSKETISSRLKTRTYMNLEAAACADQEIDFCVICQTDYKNQEKIGTLDCGHEYHVDCVKRWLLIKNTCPICKSSALTPEREDFYRQG